MSGYGKIQNGILVSANTKLDESFIDLSNFQDEDGNYSEWYNEDGTPDVDKIAEEEAAKLVSELDVQKADDLARLTVTIGSGKVFYANSEARGDLRDAIGIALDEGQTETIWKLAEVYAGSKLNNVTIEELKEASKLALIAKGEIIGAI